MIPQNPSISAPTRNQSTITFTPRINCPNYSGRVAFIACGGPNQGIVTRSLPIGGGQNPALTAEMLSPLLGIFGADKVPFYDTDKTTCVVPVPTDN
jgi:hypothetical protein